MKKDIEFVVSYTNKLPGPSGFYRREFTTLKLAEDWIAKNLETLYWHELVPVNAKSSLPKPLIQFEPGEEFQCFSGRLSVYFETGMECLGLVLERDDIRGPVNPDFNPELPEGPSNFKFFSSHEALIFLESGQIMELPDGSKVGIIKDREFAKLDKYRLSFYPRGFSRNELLALFSPEKVKSRIWVKKPKT